MIATAESLKRVADFTADECARLAREFETQSTETLLRWAVDSFAPRLVITSSFGPEGIVLIDLLSRIVPEKFAEVPVLYLDTGFHFAQTTAVKEAMRERYNLHLVEQRAAITVEQQEALYGKELYRVQPDLCCQLRKVEPLREALQSYDAWLVALRRDQSPTRANIGKVEWNAKHNLVKINPLADWTRGQVWSYILKNQLPYNLLHDEGYTSIGCAPCTQPTQSGQHERDGRWVGHAKKECGLHL